MMMRVVRKLKYLIRYFYNDDDDDNDNNLNMRVSSAGVGCYNIRV